MLWLGNVFKLREKLFHQRKTLDFDEEKPFLDHLEDLRHTLMRVITTLVVSMVICFAFNDRLFEVIKRPVIVAGMADPESSRLPEGISGDEWKEVGQIVTGLREVPPEMRSAWLDATCSGEKAKLRSHVRALEIARAAQSLPEDQRATWLEKGAGGDATALASAQTLLEKKLNLKLDWNSVINMQSFAPVEVFNQSMKISFFAGIIISFPILMYYLLQFILPGLKPEEKKVLWPSLAVGFGLFLVGVCFCYFFVAPTALRFFHEYATERGMSSDYRFSEYVSFVVQFTLIFGLAFELPVVVYALIKLGILSYPGMSRTRTYAIFIIVVVAAIITPTPDAFSLAIMAGPMILLYEVCIWIAYFDHKKRMKLEAEEEKERAAWREKNAAAALAADATHPDAHDGHGDPHHGDHGHEYHGYHDSHHDDPYHHPRDHDHETGTQDAYHTGDSHSGDSAPEEPTPPIAPGAVHPYEVSDPPGLSDAADQPTTDAPDSDDSLPVIRPADGAQRRD